MALHYGLTHRVVVKHIEKALFENPNLIKKKVVEVKHVGFVCPLCNLNMSEDSRNLHLSTHFKDELIQELPSGFPFKCPMCQFVGTDQTVLMYHYGRVHDRALYQLNKYLEKMNEEPIMEVKKSDKEEEVVMVENNGIDSCCLCESFPTFKNKNEFLRHLTDAHFVSKISEEVPAVKTEDNRYKCNICDFTAITRSVLLYHYGLFHKKAVEFYNALMGNQEALKIKTTATKLRTSLDITRKPLKDKRIVLNTEPVPIQCKFCPMTFINDKLRLEHLSQTHFSHLMTQLPSEKPFKCPSCMFHSTSRLDLFRHYGFHHKLIKLENDVIKTEPEENIVSSQEIPNTPSIEVKDEFLGSSVENNPSSDSCNESVTGPSKVLTLKCFMCDDCKPVASSQGEFAKHLVDIHFKNDLLKFPKEIFDEEKGRRFQCPVCQYEHVNKKLLAKHYGLKHKIAKQMYNDALGMTEDFEQQVQPSMPTNGDPFRAQAFPTAFFSNLPQSKESISVSMAQTLATAAAATTEPVRSVPTYLETREDTYIPPKAQRLPMQQNYFERKYFENQQVNHDPSYPPTRPEQENVNLSNPSNCYQNVMNDTNAIHSNQDVTNRTPGQLPHSYPDVADNHPMTSTPIKEEASPTPQMIQEALLASVPSSQQQSAPVKSSNCESSSLVSEIPKISSLDVMQSSTETEMKPAPISDNRLPIDTQIIKPENPATQSASTDTQNTQNQQSSVKENQQTPYMSPPEPVKIKSQGQQLGSEFKESCPQSEGTANASKPEDQNSSLPPESLDCSSSNQSADSSFEDEVEAKCRLCNEVFSAHRYLFTHLSEKHFQAELDRSLPQAPPWKCPSCPYTGGDPKALRIHYGVRHKIVLDHLALKLGVSLASLKKQMREGRKQAVASKPAAIMNRNRKTSQSDIGQPSKALPPYKAIAEDKKFPKCRICDYRYFTRLDLCRHFVDNHLRGRLEYYMRDCTSRCPVCPLEYQTQQSRLRHYIWSHKDLERMVIDSVGVRLSEFMPSMRDLDIVKMKNVQKPDGTPSKPEFKDITDLASLSVSNVVDVKCNVPSCELCGEEFTTSVNKVRDKGVHLLSHFRDLVLKQIPNKKPFNCPKCTFEGRDVMDLSRHYGLSHKVVFSLMKDELGFDWTLGETEAFDCKICHQVLLNARALNDHYCSLHFYQEIVKNVPTEPPFKCNSCPFQSKTFMALIRHHGSKHKMVKKLLQEGGYMNQPKGRRSSTSTKQTKKEETKQPAAPPAVQDVLEQLPKEPLPNHAIPSQPIQLPSQPQPYYQQQATPQHARYPTQSTFSPTSAHQQELPQQGHHHPSQAMHHSADHGQRSMGYSSPQYSTQNADPHGQHQMSSPPHHGGYLQNYNEPMQHTTNYHQQLPYPAHAEMNSYSHGPPQQHVTHAPMSMDNNQKHATAYPNQVQNHQRHVQGHHSAQHEQFSAPNNQIHHQHGHAVDYGQPTPQHNAVAQAGYVNNMQAAHHPSNSLEVNTYQQNENHTDVIQDKIPEQQQKKKADEVKKTGKGGKVAQSPMACPICKGTFVNTTHFLKHAVEKHFLEQLKRELPNTQPFKCPFCEFCGKDFKMLARHYGLKHDIVIRMLNERNGVPNSFDKSILKTFETTDGERELCPLCKSHFGGRYMLLRHLADCHFRERLCRGLPPGDVFKCPACNHESKDKGGFVRHYGLVHKMVQKWLLEQGIDIEEQVKKHHSREEKNAEKTLNQMSMQTHASGLAPLQTSPHMSAISPRSVSRQSIESQNSYQSLHVSGGYPSQEQYYSQNSNEYQSQQIRSNPVSPQQYNHRAITPQSYPPLTPQTPQTPLTPHSHGAQTPQPSQNQQDSYTSPLTPHSAGLVSPPSTYQAYPPESQQALSANNLHNMQNVQQHAHNTPVSQPSSSGLLTPVLPSSENQGGYQMALQGTMAANEMSKPTGNVGAATKQQVSCDGFFDPPDPGASGPFYIQCKKCSNISKTKSDFYRHLSERHFKNELLRELPEVQPYKCPVHGCTYQSKDNTLGPLIKHYGIVHKTVVKFFNGTTAGKFVPSSMKPIGNVKNSIQNKTKQQPHPPLPNQLTDNFQQHQNQDMIQQGPAQNELTISNQALTLKCPFCEVMFSAAYPLNQHLCDKHFKEEIAKHVPVSAPFACPVTTCSYVSKDSRQALIRHYGMTHKVVNELLQRHAPGFAMQNSVPEHQQQHMFDRQVQNVPHPAVNEYHPNSSSQYSQPQQRQPQYGTQQYEQPHMGAASNFQHNYMQPQMPDHAKGIYDYNQHHHQQQVAPPVQQAQTFASPNPVSDHQQGSSSHMYQPQPHYDDQAYTNHPQSRDGLPSMKQFYGQQSQPVPGHPHEQHQHHNEMQFDQQIDGTFDPTHYSDQSSLDGIRSLPTTPKKEPNITSNENVKAEEMGPSETPIASVLPNTQKVTKSNKKPPRMCEVCGKMFDGKNKAMLRIQHLAQHFKDKLFLDLKTKGPPYCCPIPDCPYQTKHKPDWARHYGSVHKFIDKYLQEHLAVHPLPTPQNNLEKKVVTAPEEKPSSNATSSVTQEASFNQDNDTKFSNCLPKEELSQIISTAMSQQGQADKESDFPLLNADVKDNKLSSDNQLDLISQMISESANESAATFENDNDELMKNENSTLQCFMCDDGLEFQTEDQLNKHISANHFDFTEEFKNTGEKLTLLSTSDVEATLVPSENAAAVVPSTSNLPTISARNVVKEGKKNNTGRPCEICGYEPKTKNKSRERSDHLTMKHYKEQIDRDLAQIKDLTCPICGYKGRDKQAIHRHYTGKHRVVEQYLENDIASGKVIPLGSVVNSTPAQFNEIDQSAMANFSDMAVQGQANVQLQVITNPMIERQPFNQSLQEGILQVDGACDDIESDLETEVMAQVDGNDEEADDDMETSSEGGLPKTLEKICPLCGEETKFHKNNHYAVKHFKQRLVEILPKSAPFKCIDCDYIAKARINMWTHYLGRHKHIQSWLAEAIQAQKKGSTDDVVGQKDQVTKGENISNGQENNEEIKVKENLEKNQANDTSEMIDIKEEFDPEISFKDQSLEKVTPSKLDNESVANSPAAPKKRNSNRNYTGRKDEFWCDFCQKVVKDTSKNVHYVNEHFKERLLKVFTSEAPFICPYCHMESKHFNNAALHYLTKHNLMQSYITQAMEELTAKAMERLQEEKEKKLKMKNLLGSINTDEDLSETEEIVTVSLEKCNHFKYLNKSVKFLAYSKYWLLRCQR